MDDDNDAEYCDDDPELVGSAPQERNWKGIIIAVVIIILIIVLVVIAVIIVSPDDDIKFAHPNMTITDFLEASKDSIGNYFPAQGEYYYHYGDNGVNPGAKTDYLYQTKLMQPACVLYSPNCTTQEAGPLVQSCYKFLVAANGLAMFAMRRSGENTLAHLSTRNSLNQKFSEKGIVYKAVKGVNFSPDSSKFVVITDADIRMIPMNDLESFKTVEAVPESAVGISLGVPDWIYGEEVILTGEAFWWSPSSKYFAYLVFDDSKIRDFEIPDFDSNNENIWKTTFKMKYPLAGEENSTHPIVTLKVFDNGASRPFIIKDVDAKYGKDWIFSDAAFLSDETIVISLATRTQSAVGIMVCDVATAQCREKGVSSMLDAIVLGLKWLDFLKLYTFPLKPDEENAVFTIYPKDQILNGLFNHVFQVTKGGLSRLAYSQGEFDVFNVVHYDAASDSVFYIGSSNSLKKPFVADTRYRNLYVSKGKEPLTPAMTCLTCESPMQCIFVEKVHFVASSPNKQLKFILDCRSGPTKQYLAYLDHPNMDSADYVVDGKLFAVTNVTLMWTDTIMEELVSTRSIANTTWFLADLDDKEDVRINEKGETEKKPMKVWVKVRHSLKIDCDYIYKWPVLISVYNGPTSQSVNFRFRLEWEDYVAQSLGVIVITADTRGTRGRGEKFRQKIYQNMGAIELKDQLAVRASILKRFSNCANTSEVAFFGWSYGGYLVTRMLGEEPLEDSKPPFTCGIAVAPVTDWKLYDTIYTERYMGRYKDSQIIYKAASAWGINDGSMGKFERLENFKNSKFYLLHGMADKNVHFQHSAILISKLKQIGMKTLRADIFPNSGHSMASNEVLFYETLNEFLADCYGMKLPEVHVANLKEKFRDDSMTTTISPAIKQENVKMLKFRNNKPEIEY